MQLVLVVSLCNNLTLDRHLYWLLLPELRSYNSVGHVRWVTTARLQGLTENDTLLVALKVCLYPSLPESRLN